MASGKKIDANGRNSHHSTGPKTERGKEHVKFNALKHGIFVRELVISDEEKPDFEALHFSLHDQLQPDSPLQRIGFERIVCCCWRCRLATRHEMVQVGVHLELEKDQGLQNDSPPDNILSSRWYGTSNADLNKAIRLLGEVRQDVATNGWIRAEQWKDMLTKAFGEESFKLFTEWNPMSIDAALLANHLLSHEKAFNKPLPPLPADSKEGGLAVDPQLCWQMSVKLIDLTIQHLAGLAVINKVAAHGPEWQGAAALDLATRYYTTATRDLERAVKWYQDLKTQGL